MEELIKNSLVKYGEENLMVIIIDNGRELLFRDANIKIESKNTERISREAFIDYESSVIGELAYNKHDDMQSSINTTLTITPFSNIQGLIFKVEDETIIDNLKSNSQIKFLSNRF